MVWGQIAGSVASSVLSSAFGGGGTSAKKVYGSMMDQAQIQRIQARKLPKAQVEGAQAAGLHPLTVIGMNPGAGISASYSGDPSSMGQNIGRAAAAGINGYHEAKLEKLALERAQLENDLLRSQITNVNRQAGDPPVAVKESPIPLWQTVYDQKSGKTISLPNPKAVEGIESSGIVSGTIFSSEVAGGHVAPSYFERAKAALKKQYQKSPAAKISRWYKNRKKYH
jgi:hypothetical protein